MKSTAKPQSQKGFAEVFDAELAQIADRRARYSFESSPPKGEQPVKPNPDHEQVEREHTAGLNASWSDESKSKQNAAAASLDAVPLRQTLTGLALSGGGIRSATYCLGLLQGLNDLNLLMSFDYLSTVSGGGFVGGWWSAWLARRPAREPKASASVPIIELPKTVVLPPKMEFEKGQLVHRGVMSIKDRDALLLGSTDTHFREAVASLFKMSSLFPPEERIEPKRSAEYQSAGASRAVSDSSINAGVDPIHHLRLFSNYLTPRKGWLSADTWRAAAVVSRNLVLTWLVLLPILLAIVLVGRIYFAGVAPDESITMSGDLYQHGLAHQLLYAAIPAISAVILMILISGYWFYLVITESDLLSSSSTKAAPEIQPTVRPKEKTKLSRLLMAPLFLRAGTERIARNAYNLGLARFSLATVAVMTLVFIWELWAKGFVGGTSKDHKPLIVTIAWLLVFVAYSAISLMVRRDRYHSLSTAGSTEVRRNWLIRRHSETFAAGSVVTGLLMICGPGAQVFAWIVYSGHAYIQSVSGATIAMSIAGAIFTALRNAPAGGIDAEENQDTGLLVKIILRVTPPLVLLVVMTLFAFACRAMVTGIFSPVELRIGFRIGLLGSALVGVVFAAAECLRAGFKRNFLAIMNASVGLLAIALEIMSLIMHSHHWWNFTPARQMFIDSSLFVFAVTWVLAFGCMADPNELSLHAFYKARLVRAYLGASNKKRHESEQGRRDFEVTEAVDEDDIPLNQLAGNCKAGGPFHLINTTLNLVASHDLGTVQRHAASFVFSGLFCGSDRTGYRDTAGKSSVASYIGERLSLGTAMAVSGAAVSPNMGSVSMTSAESMLLTLANVRLGFWAPTPNFPHWNEGQPRYWPFFVLREFLSNTNDQSSYCYLTDGGHFDNTGLYPLVQRGCRNILIADCGADRSPSKFADLGDAIRRCRIDFGAEISFGLLPFLSEVSGERLHFSAGTITYSESHAESLKWGGDLKNEANRQGRIIVVKPSLIATEPVDVRQYGFENRSFPQQSTAEQWFDEAQFESYRKLGFVSAEELFGKLVVDKQWLESFRSESVFPVDAIKQLFEQAGKSS